MKKLEDYSMMLGLLDKWTKEDFENAIKEYSEAHSKVLESYNQCGRNLDILGRNIAYFKRRLKDIENTELAKNFVLKPEHLKILSLIEMHISGLNISINNTELNHSFIKKIFNIDEDEISQKQKDKLFYDYEKLIKELPYVITDMINQNLKSNP